MEKLDSFADERLVGACALGLVPECTKETSTWDHAPSRVFLDQPYPANTSKMRVRACEPCNAGASLHEAYVACLLECVVVGSTKPSDMRREKIRRLLAEKPRLQRRIERARKSTKTGVVFEVETERVERVVLKLARGHAAFELGELQLEEPTWLTFVPVTSLSPVARDDFETPLEWPVLWPEVGSRAMQRLAMALPGAVGWIVVQEGRYRYQVVPGDEVVVRILLSEYLGCEVRWSVS